MDISQATKALGALSQETRLKTFRLLVRSGNAGMAAGHIADALQIPHNTLSTHLATLVNAGLVDSRRASRSIIYSIDFEGTRALFKFLLQDCCQGSQDLCRPLLENLLPVCCETNNLIGENS